MIVMQDGAIVSAEEYATRFSDAPQQADAAHRVCWPAIPMLDTSTDRRRRAPEMAFRRAAGGLRGRVIGRAVSRERAPLGAGIPGARGPRPRDCRKDTGKFRKIRLTPITEPHHAEDGSFHRPGVTGRSACRDIQSGVAGAGAWLQQIDLQERYGAKRLDVRRALDHLTQKRVIEHVPNRGYPSTPVRRGTPEPHPRHPRDAEVGAAADLMPHVTDARRAQLRAMAERFEQLVLTGTLLQLIRGQPAVSRGAATTCAPTANWSR